ncbi:MAG: S-layer homology domain-containing protein, partial [Acutalibacter sp.]|nr:S-layer homology domain-containing protein [Acutalibacter sp.]
DCSNTGKITGSAKTPHAGGIVGMNSSNSAVTTCSNSGSVTCNDVYSANIGGVVGKCLSESSVTGCWNTGTITGIRIEFTMNAGGVVGYNVKGAVTGCYNNGAVTGGSTGSGNHGGVIGENSGTLEDCYNTGEISGVGSNNNFVGGVAGSNSSGSTLTNCHNIGTVVLAGEKGDAGGVVGNSRSLLQNCYNTGIVTSNSDAGGVVGYNANTTENCYNTGKVTGNLYVGGIVGMNNGTTQNCYNTNEVTDAGGENACVGGAVGYLFGGTIKNSYNIGTVTGSNKVGGIVGNTRNSVTVETCYYLSKKAPGGISGADVADQAESKTAGEFAAQDTFAGWDFTTIWEMGKDEVGNNVRPVFTSNREENLQPLPKDPKCSCHKDCSCADNCGCEESNCECVGCPGAPVKAESATISPNPLELKLDETKSGILIATVEPMECKSEIAWEIVNGTGVVSISPTTGAEVTVTALQSGTAVVKVTVDGQTDTCTVTVQEADSKCGCHEDCNCTDNCKCGENECDCTGCPGKTPEPPKCGCENCDSEKCTCTGECTDGKCECEGCKSETPPTPECGCEGCDSEKCTCTGDCTDGKCECEGCNPETPPTPGCGCEDCDSSKCTCTGDCTDGKCECAGCNPETPSEPKCECKNCDSSKCTCTGDCSGSSCKCSGCAGKPSNPNPNPNPNPGPGPNPDPGPGPAPAPEECDGGANCPSRKFIDLDNTKWYHKAMDYVISKGLMSGTGDATFSPNAPLTRAMLVTILWRSAGSPKNTLGYNPFKDVPTSQYYYQAVMWAYEHNVVAGTTSTTFSPNSPITREQLAAILWRYAGSPGTTGSLAGFTDSGKISSYAEIPMRWALEKGIVSGKGNGILDPGGKSTRAEAASMLMRYLERDTDTNN